MNRRTTAIGIVCFLLGLVLGILAQPWALSRYVKSLHDEIELLEKMNRLQQQQLNEINAVLEEE